MKYEKEMRKGIIKFLQKGIGCKYIADEVNSGYGTADFVGTAYKTKVKKFHFNNIIDVFFLNRMRVGQPVHVEEIEKRTYYSKKYLTNFILKNYITQGLLAKIEKDVYVRLGKLNMHELRVVAVEAKLSRWKEAFYQSTSYKKFADYSFVALYDKYINNVNLQLFKDNNIGLIAVDNNLEFDILRKPKINRELNLEAKLFVSGLTFKTKMI